MRGSTTGYGAPRAPDGRVGLLVADVVDKGVAAALFMALSWILVRTYAEEYPNQPALVLSAVNDRILRDTAADQFVTAFYGVLDPQTGKLVYSNAGHCPPFLISAQDGEEPQQLVRTGMPLGILEDASWESRSVDLGPGDVLVLYTDGITEAENADSASLGEEGVVTAVRATLGESALAIREAILAALGRFVGTAAHFDDTALAVLVRDAGQLDSPA